MTIAVQIPPDDTAAHFNYQCFSLLAGMNPADHFIFISDSPYDPALVFHPNITPVLLPPQMKNNLLQQYWYHFKLPRIIQKYNAQVFISSTGLCSLRTNAEQYLFLDDKITGHKKGKLFSKKYTRLFRHKAVTAICPNLHVKEVMEKKYPLNEPRFIVIPDGCDEKIQPYTVEKKEAIRNRISGGMEFFACFDLRGLKKQLSVLKAFSIFRKWQHSGMKLLMVIPAGEEAALVKNLATYKHRDYVILVTDTRELPDMMATAYAGIWMPGEEKKIPGISTCLQYHTPVILPNQAYFKSTYGQSAIYATPDEKSIADMMMLLYKNEEKRNQLILEGRQLVESHSWNNITRLVWQSINPFTEP
jgi:glycosyltransferase involved in cell wall biosynthesis